MEFTLSPSRVPAVDNSSEFRIWNVEKGILASKVILSPPIISLTSAAWHPEGHELVVGGTRGSLSLFNLRGNRLPLPKRFERSFASIRIQGLAYSNDGKTLLTLDIPQSRILEHDWVGKRAKQCQQIVKEDAAVMSFAVDQLGQRALVNVCGQGVRLWDLKGGCHDWTDAEWIVKRGPLRGHNDTPFGWTTPGRPIGRPGVG
jgi:WD40 repeat protein